MVDARENSVLSTRFNTCLSYFKVESKIIRDIEAQCSLSTYNDTVLITVIFVSVLNKTRRFIY